MLKRKEKTVGFHVFNEFCSALWILGRKVARPMHDWSLRYSHGRQDNHSMLWEGHDQHWLCQLCVCQSRGGQGMSTSGK